MLIRPMTPNDYARIDLLMQQLHQIHLQARPDLFVPLEHPYSQEEFCQMTVSSQKICLVAEQDGEIAGLCIVTMKEKSGMKEGTTAYIDDLFVNPDFRRQGIGKLLFLKAQTLAKHKGASRIDLKVWAFNRSALDFYHSLGLCEQRFILEKNL